MVRIQEREEKWVVNAEWHTVRFMRYDRRCRNRSEECEAHGEVRQIKIKLRNGGSQPPFRNVPKKRSKATNERKSIQNT